MLVRKFQKGLVFFLNNDKPSPFLAAIAAGLYPILFYYSKNFSLVNSWGHLFYFIAYFIVLPLLTFVISDRLFKLTALQKWHKYVIPFLNVFTFLFLVMLCLYAGINKKIGLVIIVMAALFAYFLYKHLKKVIILELLLAVIALFSLVPVVVKDLTISEVWMQQPDAIAEVIFKRKPNVYMIQPDGFIGFSELRKGNYQYDNYDFENLLKGEEFTLYPNFRSNYATTLSSNSSAFMMKHHYYGKGVSLSEGFNARKVIISKNTVLDVFKRNGYKTHFITEKPYILINKPKIGYDVCNFRNEDISFLGTGLNTKKDVKVSLKQYLVEDIDSNNFFFIEFFNPGHIANIKLNSEGKEKEREKWLESLKVAHQNLADLIAIIKEKDPEGLIIIMADHGGFVGMDYTRETYNKTQDRSSIYSVFSSQLSIHWPNNQPPLFDKELKSSVNVFRIIFSYLSQDESYLLNLQENASFVVIRDGAPTGIYKYIDEEGNVVFEKVE